MKLIPPWLQRPFERALTPIADWLIRQGVHPNTLTSIGLLIVIGAAVAFGVGMPRVGGAVLLLSGCFDVLDGKVARGGGRMSPFGAFYDSTLDRVGEAILFGGIAVYFVTGGVPPEWQMSAVIAVCTALAGGLIVSYSRARAEGLQIECKVGLIQRAERLVGLGVPMMFFGAGRNGWLLLSIVAVLGALSMLTVLQRIVHVYRLTGAPTAAERPAKVPKPVPAGRD